MNDSPTPSTDRRRKPVLLTLSAIVLALALAATAWWLLVARYRVVTDNAYVAGNIVQITPQVAGVVRAIHVDDTARVTAGQVLVELDDTDARIALQAAEAALAETVRSVRALYTGANQSTAVVAQRQAEIERVRQLADAADAELQQARDDFARKESLFRRNFISADALQVARTQRQAAEARHAAAQASITEARSALAGAHELQAGAQGLVGALALADHPRVQAAASRFREAWLALQRTRIAAPEDGTVARRKVQLGERVTPGSALLAVIPDARWIDANFKETELADVRIGQPVRLTADLWGSSVEYSGTVSGLAAGTGAAFAVLPAQNASGNWIKIVQRLPVRIALDAQALKDKPLGIGLSMRVAIDTHDRSGALLATPTPGAAPQRTHIHDDALAEADARIAAIIAANR